MGGAQAVMLKREESIDFLIFFKPFKWQIWLTFALVWIVYASILTFISFLSMKTANSTKPKEDFTFWESLCYFSLGSVQMGVDKHPVSTGGKVLKQWWSFFCLIFVATYTANLAAIFSENSLSKPLKSIDEIIHSDYNVSGFDIYEEDIKSLDNCILNKLIKRGRVQFINITHCGWRKGPMERLMAGDVWVDFDANIEWLKGHIPEKHRLYTLDGYFSYVSYGFAMRNGWRHQSKVRELLERFSRSGVIDQIVRKYKRDWSAINETKTGKSLRFDSYAGVFCCVFFAGLIAVIISIIDYFYDKSKKRRGWVDKAWLIDAKISQIY